MNVGKAIYYLLANNANVSAITTRIYPEIAPQDAAAPYIVYTISNVSPDDTHDGPATIDEVRMEITCVADTYDVAGDLASKARVALDRVYGTYNTVNVESIQFQDVQIQVRDTPRQYGQELTFIVRVKRDDVQIATGSPIEDITLGRLADVDTAGATDDQVLTYDAATDSWGPEDASTVAALNDLTDVTIDTPANNQALVYNSAAGEWRNDQLSLTQLEGISSELGDAIDRQALVYDEASNQWIADGVGQVVIPVRNPSRDDSIAVGTVLKATGSQGDRILVAPFQPTDDPKLLVGIASEVIGTGADGHAQVYGELRDIDTDAYDLGAVLYPGVDGTLTTTANEYPIAIVTRKQQNTGRIFIRTWTPGRSRYNAEAETLRAEMETSLPSADIEYYFSAQADGYGFAQEQESDSVVNSTPAEDYQVERAIYYNPTGLASYVSDSGWVTLETNVESFAASKARIDAYIRGATYGSLPCTFAIVRTEELIPTTLLAAYPGAAAAYSLRLIGDGDYAGSAIRVRRASDNTEQDIGFDGNGDLDTSALATFCAGTDGFVKTWYDQSGNANDATQTTTSAQPKVYDSVTGVVTDNGNPALKPLAAQGMNTGVTLNDFSVIAVGNNGLGLNNNASQGYALSTYSGSGSAVAGDLILRYLSDYDLLQGSASVSVASAIQPDNFLIFAKRDGANLSLAFNNGAYATALGTTTTTKDIYLMGAAGGGFIVSFQAMQEIIIYNSAQSDANRTGIETNINDYYTIF